MTKARVNGVECTIYDFAWAGGFTICRVAYAGFDILLPVLTDLIEVEYENQ